MLEIEFLLKLMKLLRGKMVYNGTGKLMIDYMSGYKKMSIYNKGLIKSNTYYFALRCKYCGTWRAKETKNICSARFKCFVCNKEVKLRLVNKYGFNCDCKKCHCMNEAKVYVQKMNGARIDDTL